MIRRPRALAPIREYADLGRALLAHRIELDASRREIEAALGWPRGLLRAIETNRKCLSEATTGPLLDLLGLRLILRDDTGHEIECASYQEIVAALIARRHALGLSQEDINYSANLQDGYSNKLEVGIRRLGPKSLPALLGALRLQMHVEPRLRHRWQPPEPAIYSPPSYIVLPLEIAT